MSRKIKTIHDNTTNYKTIKIDEADEILVKKPFVCMTCGKRFTKQRDNFPIGQSELYRGNNRYIPTCNNCLEKLYSQYENITRNPREAIRRICLHYDIYYSNTIADSVLSNISAGQSVVKKYISICNLHQYKGKTYDNSLAEDSSEIIKNEEDFNEAKSAGKFTITKSVLDRFGIGIGNEEDYRVMNDHYKKLKNSNPNCDSNQEIFILSLCKLQMLQNRALKNNDTKMYTETNKEYMNTFKQAGLKAATEDGVTDKDSFGAWLEIISHYTPEEYYKDKKLYKDFDGIGDFCKRHVFRPLKNLLCKTNERDKECFIGDEDE